MIISIAGRAGSGKSSVGKELAKKLGYKHYSMGDFMGELAKERGVSLLKISKLAESSTEIDSLIDEKQKKLGNNEDDFVIDSRLGFHFIPKSIKVFLDVDIKVAAERIYNDERLDEQENTSLDTTEENIIKRTESEKKRYREYYNLNPYDPSNYDLLIDTTGQTIIEVVDEILDYLKSDKAYKT